MKKYILQSIVYGLLLVNFLSCRKVIESSYPEKIGETNLPNFGRVNACDSMTSLNAILLKMVISGSGGTIEIDTSKITFPSYDPPINIGGMLSFSSKSAYNSFINATYLLEDYWEYSNVDNEGTPAEIDNLGEEPLNALDCALDFNSLRYKNCMSSKQSELSVREYFQDLS